MKKKLLITLLVINSLFNFVFAASKKGFQIPDDEEIPQEEMTTVVFNKSISIIQIDDYYDPYRNVSISKAFKTEKKLFDKKLTKEETVRTVYLKAGEHEINFGYSSGGTYAQPIKIKVNFEAGKSYDVLAIIEKGKVSRVVYDIQYSDTHESILPKTGLSLKEKLAIQYVQTILQPVSEGKQIKLEGSDPVKKIDPNDFSKYLEKERDYIIEFGEDLTVTYTEKGKVHTGYIGFEATKAIIYIKFDDNKSLTKEEFLKLPIDSCDLIFEIEDINSFGKMTSVEISRTKPNKKGTISLSMINQ